MIDKVNRIKMKNNTRQLLLIIMIDKASKISLVWFYGISTIVGYLMPNSFLYI